MIRYFIILFALLLLSENVLAQEDKEHVFHSDTIRVNKRVQVLGLPVVFYTPESSFGVGGGLQLFFPNQNSRYNKRISNIFSTVIYTVNKQLSVNVIPQLYLFEGKMFLEGDFLYKIYPNSFWGVGSNMPDSNLEKYNMETFSLRIALLNRIPPSLNFGFEYQFEDHKMLEVAEGGLLDTAQISGSDGARTSGLSFVLNYDDRDNIYSPVSGNYLIFKGGFSSKTFGATYAYNRYLIDLRKYVIMAGKHTLALQVYLNATAGDVPFQSMAWLGGPERNRGYFKGRYMDKSYLLFQAETRWRIHSRIHLNAFASLGQVAEISEDLFIYPKFSGGVGLRYRLLKSNPTLIRVDFGVTQYGDTGIYFGVNEAF
jgi:outer membrane protein assembly factor BamA